MTWIRVEPAVSPGGNCGGNSQVSDAYHVRWYAQANDKDYTDPTFAVVDRFYYLTALGARTFLEQRTEYTLCGDWQYPWMTEAWSDTSVVELRGDDPYQAAVEASTPTEAEWLAVAGQMAGAR